MFSLFSLLYRRRRWATNVLFLFGATTLTAASMAFTQEPSRALTAVPKDGVKRALLVGVDDYAEFADLKYAVADVEAIRAKLLELGFKPENIVELKSTSPANLRPSQRNIDRQIDALLNSAGPNDLLFLLFSGHGFQTNGAVRFAPLDAVATGDEEVVDAETTISLTEIMERLKTSKAKFKWMIIDACRENPTGTRSAAASAKALKNIDPPPGMLVLQSCSEGELSYEDPDAGRGLFTGRLIEAFDGKADLDDDGIVSAQEVCKYARDQTLAASKTRFPAPQTPRMSAVDFGDFVVADDLKKDGLTREAWAQAQMWYEEAVKATEAEKYATAREKIDAALAIVDAVPDANAEKKRYAYQKKIVERFLNLETPADVFKWEFDENGATLCGFKDEALENIVIPAKVDGKPVVAIDGGAFFNCDVLKLVSFPDGLKTIGNNAFYNCDALQSVSFPDGLQTIGYSAFESCNALQSFSVSATSSAFRVVDGVLFTADGKTLVAYPGGRKAETYHVPDGVETIGDRAFSGCSALQSVSFPDGLQTIGDAAFWMCDALQSVSFPDDLQTIGYSAFEGCSALESVSFPDGLQTIDNRAFFDCSALESVSFPDGLQTIGYCAFDYCKALKSVSFPDGLQTIDDHAFAGCSSLQTVSFPDGLQTIGYSAFGGCNALQSFSVSATSSAFRVVDGVLFTADGKTLVAYPGGRKAETYRVPDGVETIGVSAFSSCSALESVSFPDGLQTIGNFAFSSCSALESVSFPDGLQTIGDGAFSSCSALQSFSVSATSSVFRVVDGVLFTADGKTLVAYPGGRKAETYRVPDGVETIGDNAFSSCAALESVSFPDGLQTIGDSAFSWCNALQSVSFPDGLQTIGKYALYSSAVKSVELPRETKCAQDAFPRDCEIRVR